MSKSEEGRSAGEELGGKGAHLGDLWWPVGRCSRLPVEDEQGSGGRGRTWRSRGRAGPAGGGAGPAGGASGMSSRAGEENGGAGEEIGGAGRSPRSLLFSRASVSWPRGIWPRSPIWRGRFGALALAPAYAPTPRRPARLRAAQRRLRAA